MSHYDWEQGTIVIPAAAWAELKRTLIAAWNAWQDARYVYACQVHAEVMAAGRGRRGFDFAGAIAQRYQKAPCTVCPQVSNVPYHDQPKILAHGAKRPNKPRKKDWPPATGKATSFPLGEAHISLDAGQRTVHWGVDQNNHAVDMAHEHPLAKALFRALGRVEWTRKSGGVVVGNDEYNEESRDEGGTANYVTMRFGPPEKPARPARRSRPAYGW